MSTAKTKQFDTKRIKWKSAADGHHDCYILLQNENGPCPLVALVNTLILREWLQDRKSRNPDQNFADYVYGKSHVTVEVILQRLANSLVASLAQSPGEYADAVLALLPELTKGLNVNPQFDGSFEDGPSIRIFQSYGIDLLHGWISSSSDPAKFVLDKVKSYDEAQTFLLKSQDSNTDDQTRTEALLLSEFLEANSTQLTPEGLEVLADRLELGIPLVLFRNDHFSTICKAHDGLGQEQLFLLVTDSGYKKEPTIVWESLSSISGNTDSFYDGDFNLVDLENLKHTEESTESGEEQKEHDNDFHLARKLQEEEDSRMATQMSKKYSDRQGRGSQNRTAAATTTTTTTATESPARASHGEGQTNKKKPKRSKECIIC